jgi:NAD(P)-dependent dehydrogenase (short-subunit alcohol dehydrogenase family)
MFEMANEIESKSETKVAIVTGGSRGLGRSTALNLAKKGVDVIITYHSNVSEANTTVAAIEAQGRRAAALQLDVSNSKSFAGFVDQVRDTLGTTFGRDRFDFLVNNAGTGNYTPFEQTTEEAFDTMVNIHLKGVFFLTQKLLPVMADGGRIVNLSSGLTRFTNPGSSAYAMMKGGVEVLTRYLAKELGSRGITANTVAPGAIETDFGGGMVRNSPELKRRISEGTALGRVGLPEDIGPMIASLLSDDNRWVNGQRIEVSGGALL